MDPLHHVHAFPTIRRASTQDHYAQSPSPSRLLVTRGSHTWFGEGEIRKHHFTPIIKSSKTKASRVYKALPLCQQCQQWKPSCSKATLPDSQHKGQTTQCSVLDPFLLQFLLSYSRLLRRLKLAICFFIRIFVDFLCLAFLGCI